MATGPTRTAGQREIGRALTVKGILAGRTHASIAAELGVDRSQVSQDWAREKAAMQRQTAEDLRDWITGELAKAEALKGEVIEAWRATCQATQEEEWIGQTPLSEAEEGRLLAAMAAEADAEPDVEPVVAKALSEFGQGHWRPKKRQPAKPNPSLPMAWNALLRTQLETLGVLQARAKNDGQASAQEPAGIPKAAEISTLEDAAGPLEMLDRMGGGRLLRYSAGRRGA